MPYSPGYALKLAFGEYFASVTPLTQQGESEVASLHKLPLRGHHTK